MKKKFTIKPNSIIMKILIPTTSIMILQMVLIILIICFGSTIETLNNKSVDSFISKVNLRSGYFETSMVSKWGNLDNDYSSINGAYEDYLYEKSLTSDEVLASNSNSVEFLEKIRDEIYLLLRRNSVTEAFIVLNTGDEKAAIVLRDNSPDINISNDADVKVEVCPASFREYYAQKHYIISAVYETRLTNNMVVNSDFLDYPYNCAINNPNVDGKYLGYWSSEFNLNDAEGISYSIPLIYNGKIYGTLGIGVQKTYLLNVLTNYTQSQDKLRNIAFMKKDSSDNVSAISTKLNNLGIRDTSFKDYAYTKYTNVYKCSGPNSYYMNFHEIHLYSENLNNYTDKWYICGFETEEGLFGDNEKVLSQVVTTSVVGLIIGVIIEICIGIYITRPIVKLSNNLDSAESIEKKKTSIYEIDLLLDELEKSNQKSLELPDKLNKIIGMVNMPFAAFEYDDGKGVVMVTKELYHILGVNYTDTVVSLDEFKERIKFLDSYVVDHKENETIYGLNGKWLSVKMVHDGDSFTGVVSDVTEQTLDKIRITKERDYDVLTGLLNRRGFEAQIEKIWNTNFNESLLMMIDLDNLKHINDKFGHSFGDNYIKLTADFINNMCGENVLGCHISGDEFLIMIHHSTKEDILKFVDDFKTNICKQYIELYGEKLYVRLSCGMAYYKSEYKTFTDYRRRADFAMYEIKNTSKNGFNFFNEESYNKNKTQLERLEMFNSLIINKKIKYAYQPIVDINTLEVLGYEALMRPISDVFKSPLDILEMAKKYNKLHDIESITIFEAPRQYKALNGDKYLFVNSLANNILTPEQLIEYSKLRTTFKFNMVIEITEEEEIDNEVMNKKFEALKSYGSLFAIDDYGTGYNNIALITKLIPNYVKIEGSFVRGIDKDENKRNLTKSVVEYCKSNKVKVIAESVETIEEYNTVKMLGVDYIQGYLVGKPAFTLEEVSLDIKNKILK